MNDVTDQLVMAIQVLLECSFTIKLCSTCIDSRGKLDWKPERIANNCPRLWISHHRTNVAGLHTCTGLLMQKKIHRHTYLLEEINRMQECYFYDTIVRFAQLHYRPILASDHNNIDISEREMHIGSSSQMSIGL